MDVVDIANFDFQAVWDLVKGLVWDMFKFPFLLFHSLPTWVKGLLLVMILIVGVILARWATKNKDAWRRLSY